jgi:hypothetical protein
MIIYNVTVNIDEDIEEEWLEWMTTKHIPEIMATNCFKDSKVYRMLSPEPEEGVTYSIQYMADELEAFEKYQIEHAAILQSEHNDKFKGKFTAYRSVLENV